MVTICTVQYILRKSTISKTFIVSKVKVLIKYIITGCDYFMCMQHFYIVVGGDGANLTTMHRILQVCHVLYVKSPEKYSN